MICPPGGDGLSSSGGRVFAFLGLDVFLLLPISLYRCVCIKPATIFQIVGSRPFIKLHIVVTDNYKNRPLFKKV